MFKFFLKKKTATYNIILCYYLHNNMLWNHAAYAQHLQTLGRGENISYTLTVISSSAFAVLIFGQVSSSLRRHFCVPSESFAYTIAYAASEFKIIINYNDSAAFQQLYIFQCLKFS